MGDLTVEQAREKVRLERSRLWLWINAPMEHAEKALDALIAAAVAQGRAEERARCEPEQFGDEGEMCEDPACLAESKDLRVGQVYGPLYGVRCYKGPYFLAYVATDDPDCPEARIFDSREAAHAAALLASPTTEER